MQIVSRANIVSRIHHHHHHHPHHHHRRRHHFNRESEACGCTLLLTRADAGDGGRSRSHRGGDGRWGLDDRRMIVHDVVENVEPADDQIVERSGGADSRESKADDLRDHVVLPPSVIRPVSRAVRIYRPTNKYGVSELWGAGQSTKWNFETVHHSSSSFIASGNVVLDMTQKSSHEAGCTLPTNRCSRRKTPLGVLCGMLIFTNWLVAPFPSRRQFERFPFSSSSSSSSSLPCCLVMFLPKLDTLWVFVSQVQTRT